MEEFSRWSRRSPYGERGLKLRHSGNLSDTFGRSPYGERGLKCPTRAHHQRADWSLSLRRAWIEIGSLAHFSALAVSRSPYGERGLKFDTGGHCVFRIKSLSLRRAWIEISKGAGKRVSEMSRSPYGERGLKCRTNRRGKSDLVALLTESVD